jgi:hypothetical protein
MAKPKKMKSYFSRTGFVMSTWTSVSQVSDQIENICLTMCEDINSVFSQRVWYSILYDQPRLLDLSLDPNDYKCHWAYLKDNLLLCAVKKYPHWRVNIDPKLEAMKTFVECEAKCRDTNSRFRSRSITDSGAVTQILLSAKRKIANILGECPSVNKLDFAFGPGAAFSIKRNTLAYDKLTSRLDVTVESRKQAVELLRSTPGWLRLHDVSTDDERIENFLYTIRGDRLSFVPKTAKTMRPIAIGPLVNVVLQKGYGSWIRRRLRRFGYNLNRLPERHKVLAKEASLTGSLATIDLSSASDTISTLVVQELLPFDWFVALDEIRSKNFEIDGTWYPYEKFSAMGNGFTFELESLIFLALAQSTCDYLGLDARQASAFGDDIIVPTPASELLYEVLDTCGFSVNESKSFTFGPFRESCGGDYFGGLDVRGFYFKDLLTPRKLVEFHNYLQRTYLRFDLKRTYRLVRRRLRPYLWLEGPDDGTDDHIVNPTIPDNHKFRFVQCRAKERKLPRRFNARLCLMLYNQTQKDSRPYRWDSYLEELSQDVKYPAFDQVRVSVSSRYSAITTSS